MYVCIGEGTLASRLDYSPTFIFIPCNTPAVRSFFPSLFLLMSFGEFCAGACSVPFWKPKSPLRVLCVVGVVLCRLLYIQVGGSLVGVSIVEVVVLKLVVVVV